MSVLEKFITHIEQNNDEFNRDEIMETYLQCLYNIIYMLNVYVYYLSV